MIVNKLKIIAAEIIERVVSEDKYHTIIDAHIKAVNKRCDDVIQNNESKLQKQLTNNSEKLTRQLNELNSKYNADMLALKSSLDKLDNLNNEISYIRIESTIMKIFIGCSIIGGIYYGLTRDNYRVPIWIDY